MAAWFGATGLAAEQLGLMDTGTLVEGRRADLLVCQGDVVQDPSLLDNGALVEVMKDGEGLSEWITGSFLNNPMEGHGSSPALAN